MSAAGGFLYLESTSMSPAVDTEQATLLYIYGASAFSCLFIILMIVVDVGGAMSDRETLRPSYSMTKCLRSSEP